MHRSTNHHNAFTFDHVIAKGLYRIQRQAHIIGEKVPLNMKKLPSLARSNTHSECLAIKCSLLHTSMEKLTCNLKHLDQVSMSLEFLVNLSIVIMDIASLFLKSLNIPTFRRIKEINRNLVQATTLRSVS